MLHLGSDFCVVEIRVHEDSNDIDHHLPDQNVNNYEYYESQPESIVPSQVLQGLVRVKDLLFVQNESTQEHDARSEEGVTKRVEPVLVVAEDLPTEKPENQV